MSFRRLLIPLALLVVLTATSMPSAQTTKNGAQSRDNGDIELVEKLLIARRDYQRSLEVLRAYYINTNDLERSKWAEEELREYHRINHQAYRLDLDVPPPTLRASVNIPDANNLVMRAKEYKDKGFGNDYIDNQRRAELLLQMVITNYSTSTRIGEAAYLLGDIYESRACKQFRRAAVYYERCFQWDPTTQLDARLRAARIYDKVVPERARAIEIYNDVLQHETNSKHKEEATRRLKELKGTGTTR